MSSPQEVLGKVSANEPKEGALSFDLSKFPISARRLYYGDNHEEIRKQVIKGLAGRFQHIGEMWQDKMMGIPIPITLEQLRREWQGELVPQLPYARERERKYLIRKVADGLSFTDNSGNFRKISEVTPLRNEYAKLPDESFSSASKYFFQIINDISGSTDREKTDFVKYITSRFRIESVDVRARNKNKIYKQNQLTDVFQIVGDWLVIQSKNRFQSPRAS